MVGGRTEQAAEKGLYLIGIPETHPAGAKAHPLLSASCGPTKVVPLLQNLHTKCFSAACKALLILWAFSARLKSCPDASGLFIEFSAACTVVPFQDWSFATGCS